jgi:hypothetical protein
MLNYIEPQPFWTKRVATESGRDPLGLSRLGDLLKDELLSGITSNNVRARYYSFYAWALWHIAREDRPADDNSFVTAFQRREAAMAMATRLDDSSSNIVGIRAIELRLEKADKHGALDCEFRVLPANRLGGYGQYYSGSLYRLGLTYRPEDAMHDLVTEERGEELAKSFHSALERTPYLEKSLFKKRRIEWKDLEQSKRHFSLDALARPFCQKERELLTQMFFGLREKTPERRSGSLCLLLHATAEYERHGEQPVASPHGALDEYLLYAFYYKSLWLENKRVPYRPPKELGQICDLWAQFCLHQFLTWALELLLCAVLDTVGNEPNGLSLDELIGQLLDEEFYETFQELTGQWHPHPQHLLTAIGVDAQPSESLSRQLQRELLPAHDRSEAQILLMEWGTPGRECAIALALLCTLYGKWRGINDEAARQVAEGAGGALFAGRILPTLDAWLDPQCTWNSVLSGLINQFIIRQHDRVWLEKGNIESRWLDWNEGHIRKEQDYTPGWRSSRHASAVSVMADLDLMKIDEDRKLSVTSRGRRILEEALKLNHGAY